MLPPFHLRPYRADDEDAAIALWQQTWQRAYPTIDFAARVLWWRERWRGELVPNAAIIVAEQAGTLIGFVTLDASGKVVTAVIERGTGSTLLDNAAVAAAQESSFSPEIDDCRPVGGTYLFRADFSAQ